MKFKKTITLSLLLASTLTRAAAVPAENIGTNPVNGLKIAARHSIQKDKPSPNFFEGALLGNGGMGVVVTTRPDAIVLHFGHNNVWDIRVTENHADKFGTFDEVFARACSIPDTLASIQHDQWFADYLNLTADNYRSPYPRPFPCGTLLLGFDRRQTEVTGHRLDISQGVCSVFLLHGKQELQLDIITDMENDHLWMALTDRNGQGVPSCFNRIRLIPDPSTPGEFPAHDDLSAGNRTIGFRQTLPYSLQHPDPAKDHAFALQVWTTTPMTTGMRTTIMGTTTPLEHLERELPQSNEPFVLQAILTEGLATDVYNTTPKQSQPDSAGHQACHQRNQAHWAAYWQASSIALDDDTLEAMWYHNLYFFNCAVKEGVTCPGIFANWSYNTIGTAWHGDYHLNYNTQQPFWITFSSNHLDKNMAYVDMVHHLLPISRKWAKEYYGMRGAFFPHSAFPVEMNIHPYPVPDWGWEVFETPWMVQGLWWHYLYSGDTDFLRQKAFEPMKDAVSFLVDYMSRPDAHGQRWGNDGKYHIFPSVPPELYGLQPGFKYNYDTQIDITLTKQIFNAYLQTVDILHLTKQEKQLANDVRRILKALPDYATTDSPIYGRILTSVPGEGNDIVYNVPANLAVVFPGNEYGLNSPDSIRQLVESTIRAHRNEGGNEIVFLNMQKARMGALDLEQFKRHVNYATLPNQTITDAVTETGGRYSDYTDYMYMGPMGIWFENFAIAAVVNECLMQSHEGAIRLFPNWNKQKRAAFSTLRAQGAFLVSASTANGQVESVEIDSEKGNTCRLFTPWDGKRARLTVDGTEQILTAKDGVFSFPTQAGKHYVVKPV